MKNSLIASPQRALRQSMLPALRSLSEIEQEMDRLLSGSFPTSYEGYDFSPSCNVKENAKEYIVQFDIPGIKKEDVQIELADNRLTVCGERKENKEEKDSKSYFSESFFGSFTRSFNLPSSVDSNKVDASYADGVLTVKIPKSQATNVKEIKIH